jgi:hypothetical protein
VSLASTLRSLRTATTIAGAAEAVDVTGDNVKGPAMCRIDNGLVDMSRPCGRGPMVAATSTDR